MIAFTATQYTEKFITNDASVSTRTTYVPEYRFGVLNEISVDFGFTKSVYMLLVILVGDVSFIKDPNPSRQNLINDKRNFLCSRCS